jgi:hypothetical protein
MEFDHVIRVHVGGTISEPAKVYAPEIYITSDVDGQISAADDAYMIERVKAQGWELLTGYSGQYGYSGPVMHPSESIGGRLEMDIRNTPGYYVALVVDDIDELNTSDDDYESIPVGWAVAYRETV